MPIANIQYEKTKDTVELLEPLIPTERVDQSQEESKILKDVLQRFGQMRGARSRIDTEWMIYQKIIEGKYYPYSDGRTSVNVPIFRALQELFVAEATARKIDRDIQPVGMSDVDKVEILKEVWEYDWNKNQRDEQMTEAEYKCCAYGTTCYLTGFSQSERVINDPSVGDDGLITFTKKLMRQGKIILKTLDIRNVYFDDRVTSFDDSNDQIYIDYITPEQFRQEMNDPNLRNLSTVGLGSKVDQAYFTYEELGKTNNNLIEKLHYFNKQADRYIVIYNRSIIGRDTPLPYAHKELPIVPRQYGKVMDSIYGRGLAEACMQFLDKYNRLSEMIFDGISRSNNSIFAVGNGLSFDGGKISFNNQVLKFNGQLNDGNFRELKGIPPNQTAFSYLQELLKEIAIFLGIDISQVIGTPSSTAFETAQRVESGLKRVNVVLTNRDYALQKVFTRHLSNIMQFFPISDVEIIAEMDANGGVKKKKKGYSKILLDGKRFVPETGKLKEEDGKFEFECDPEYIRGQMDITVKTNFNQPTLKSLKQESMKEFLTSYSTYSQISLSDPNLAKIIKPDDFIKELAFTYDIDISAIGGFADSYKKQYDELIAKVAESAGNMVGPTEGQGQMQSPIQPPIQSQSGLSSTGMSMLPNIDQSSLPPVRTPNVPSINNLSPAQKITL